MSLPRRVVGWSVIVAFPGQTHLLAGLSSPIQLFKVLMVFLSKNCNLIILHVQAKCNIN